MRNILLFLIPLSLFLEASQEFRFVMPISVEKSERPKQIISSKIAIKPSIPKAKKENPLIDSDKDGIIDSKDKCPNTSTKFIVDNLGCPQTPALNIKFESKQFTLTEKILDQVQGLAEFLHENTNYQVVIYGYTDSVGNDLDNKELSQKRADTVKEALMFYDISSTKLTAIGRGEENPIADNSTAEGREKNRRIAIELIQ